MKKENSLDLSAVLGVVGMGLCPVFVATTLTTVGIAALVPAWRIVTALLIAMGSLGFFMNFRRHGTLLPLGTYLCGAVLLYVGRYTALGGTGLNAWYIWGTGGLLALLALVMDRWRLSGLKKIESPARIGYEYKENI